MLAWAPPGRPAPHPPAPHPVEVRPPRSVEPPRGGDRKTETTSPEDREEEKQAQVLMELRPGLTREEALAIVRGARRGSSEDKAIPDTSIEERLRERLGHPDTRSSLRKAINPKLLSDIGRLEGNDALAMMTMLVALPKLGGVISDLPSAERPAAMNTLLAEYRRLPAGERWLMQEVAKQSPFSDPLYYASQETPAKLRDALNNYLASQRSQQNVLASASGGDAQSSAVATLLGSEWKDLAPTVKRQLEPITISLANAGKIQPRHVEVSVTRDGETSTHDLTLPRWELLGIERRVIRDRLVKQVGPLGPNDPVLFYGHGSIDFSTNQLLPERLSARTFDNSKRFHEKHVENLNLLGSARLDPATTIFFNLLPGAADTAIGPRMSQRDQRRWTTLRKGYDELAASRGLQVPTVSSKDALISVLTDAKLDTIVIAGHGDSQGIYFPDGSKFTVEDVLALPPIERARPPIVVLVSCETGRPSQDATMTIAQALLYRGRATAVVAPTTRIVAGGTTLEFLNKLFADNSVAAEAFKRLNGPWQLYVLQVTPSAIN
jgi:hypothetical protein